MQLGALNCFIKKIKKLYVDLNNLITFGMDQNSYKKIKAFAEALKFKPAFILLDQVCTDDEDVQSLSLLKARVNDLNKSDVNGTRTPDEIQAMKNRIVQSILTLVDRLTPLNSKGEKNLSADSQDETVINLPLELRNSKEQLIDSMRNDARLNNRHFTNLNDWVNLMVNCQTVVKSLNTCDWEDYNDRLEAYSLVHRLSNSFQELVFELRDSENENSELFDLVNCTNPVMIQILNDIENANKGNYRITSQLIAKNRTLILRIKKVLEELKILIEIGGLINWN
ncbi:MAG TPA: hypothetical protein PKE06_08145 [Flavilitoribacter sp.]|nr:hypothetical protein [Flavilitoribacter sp.]HMQ86517.1 hypothetical protein [Flavilitoribacter sp.]